jgi:hypothetical protein
LTDTVEANLNGTIRGILDHFRNFWVLIIKYTRHPEGLERFMVVAGRSGVDFETGVLAANQHRVYKYLDDLPTFASCTATNETEAAPLQMRMESPADTLGFVDDGQGRGILRWM